MTHDEFDQALSALNISTRAAALEMQELGGGKTSDSLISAMRNGRRNITQAAQIYVRLKMQLANRPSVSKADVLAWVSAQDAD